MSATPRAGVAPRSVACFGLNLLALAAGLAGVCAASRQWPADGLAAALAGCAAVALVIVAGEAWRRRGAPATGPGADAAAAGARGAGPAVLRTLGLLATVAALAGGYWLFPEYHGAFYLPYWRFLAAVGIPALLLAPFYFYRVGPRVAPGDDPYLQLGALLVRQRVPPRNAAVLRAHALGWLVKAFFLPLMVVYLCGECIGTANAWRALAPDTLHVYTFCYELSFLVDLLFCVVGYTLTLRLLDTHIRSTEPTLLGWVAALACYQPFYSVIGSDYLKYENGLYWDTWLAPYPLLRAAWAAAIIALLAIYALSTVAFGLRFSNLTHRGIVTGGPYRWFRHPAYLAKNASWWLISVPFAAHQGAFEALRHCGLLVLLNLVYLLRAKTEEWHLARDPAYRTYADWIARHGALQRALEGARRLRRAPQR